jgi:hypothetical protein
MQPQYNPATVLLDIYPRKNENLGPHENLRTMFVHSFTSKSSKLELVQVPFNK